MSQHHVSDVGKYCPESLWHLVKPVLPAHPERHQSGGRRRIDDRIVFAAITYVLPTGCPWQALPESFPLSRATAHRRFTEWVDQGVVQAFHEATLDVLGAAGQIDWSRASVDAMHVRAVKGFLRAIRQPLGRPRRWPAKVHGDKGYDYRSCRELVRRRDLIARIARQGSESTTHLGRHRYVVSVAWSGSAGSVAWPAATTVRLPTSPQSCAGPAL